jgi:hypothetical protein
VKKKNLSRKKHEAKKDHSQHAKGRNLDERIISKKEVVLAFAFNSKVPLTYNLKEKEITGQQGYNKNYQSVIALSMVPKLLQGLKRL